MNNTPSLFKYATSELSQDAAIMWLLEWARPSNKATDPNLHEIGRLLLESLYKISGSILDNYNDGDFETYSSDRNPKNNIHDVLELIFRMIPIEEGDLLDERDGGEILEQEIIS